MESIRGVKLGRVLDFLQAVKEIKARGADPAFVLQISYVVTRSNLHQMAECVDLMHRYGGHEVYFLNFATDGRTDDFANRESLMRCPEAVLPCWEQAAQRGRELGVRVYPMAFDCRDRQEEEWRRHKPNLFDGNRIRQCPLPWWSVFVDVDGTVKPCCVFYPPLGNLMEEPFRKIWNGPRFRELRRTVNTVNMPPICRHCFIQERF